MPPKDAWTLTIGSTEVPRALTYTEFSQIHFEERFFPLQ